ncbi:hypothetical protein RR68_000905 [Escherichia coli]|nr:hypothetical protein [Escherichia coli]EEW5794382.1 hypothetical protein [Escherichia coli]EFE1499368.1 hypothetical protein [Escherichia coli]EFF3179656.1 hypothetical protein [Escherichia coli]EFL8553325.1 hypothetical protein [Escherichia coli]
MYVAVKGGEKAIDAAHALQESRRRGDTDLPELSVAQIEQQLNLAVDRVMTEGGIADRELAALALKQASGDNVEAIFLLRAYRTTLAKLAVSEPLDTTEMRLERRISAVYKDIPGGQLLGPTYDYTHRLLDFTLLANGEAPTLTTADSEQQPSPHVFSLLARQGLVKFEEDSGAQPDDITRTPPVYPCSRSSRLQQLMRGDEGYLLALAYSTQRGYGRNHPFAGEIRSGYIDVSIVPEELEEYGVMQVKLYEDIARFGHIATTYAYPVKVNGRYVMDPSPIPKFDNPKMDMMPALQLFGAGREKRIYAVPPFTRVESLDFDDHPFTVQQWDEPCAICGSTHSYLDEVVLDDAGNRMFVCSDTDYCRQQSEAKNQ